MDYRATLNLPQTSFKMKANLTQREPAALKRWEKEDLYQQIQKHSADKPLFVLHDGPPYANGNIHLGTAFNKILKDIILRSRRMAGFNAPYIPGWDCHGLPIEHNVDKELGEKKKNHSDPLQERVPAESTRRSGSRPRKQSSSDLASLGDWDNPYLTMNYAYEATIAREFNKFLLLRIRGQEQETGLLVLHLHDGPGRSRSRVPRSHLTLDLCEIPRFQVISPISTPGLAARISLWSSGRRLPGPCRPTWLSPFIPILTMPLWRSAASG